MKNAFRWLMYALIRDPKYLPSPYTRQDEERRQKIDRFYRRFGL
jgi:hypothetical protein